MVAENNDDCRCAGRAAAIRRMSRMKPRSSMRSASSSTKCCAASSRSCRPSSDRRCVQACRPRCRRRLALLSPVATGYAAHDGHATHLQPGAELRRLSSICCASSRVGARISARVWNGAARTAAVGQVLQQRQAERRGLAGAGLGDAEQVAPGQQWRDGRGLDQRWRGGNAAAPSARSSGSAKPSAAKVGDVTWMIAPRAGLPQVLLLPVTGV